MATIRIRNVPEELHCKLKERAAAEGLSLSSYLLRMAESEGNIPSDHEADTLSFAELNARIRQTGRVVLGEPPAETIRRMRDAAD